MSRLSKDDLIGITGKSLPAVQARWFKQKYGVILPHDKDGVIITENAWEGLVAKQCGLVAMNDAQRQSIKPTTRKRA